MFAGLYLFVVLPHVFAMLVVMFAGVHPDRHAAAASAVQHGDDARRREHATFISIQGAYDADFFVFLNSNLAGVAGLLFAYVWTRATRPFGAELAVRRLLRSGWEDVARSASTQPLDDQRNHASRMLDRVTQLLPRLGASDDHRHPSIESFRDLRIALNALDLRRSRRGCPATCPTRSTACWPASPITTNAAPPRTRQPAPPALLATIDDALQRVAGRNMPGATPTDDGTAPTAPPRPPHRPRRHASPAARHAARARRPAPVCIRPRPGAAGAGQHAHDPAFPSVLPTATMIGEIDIFGVFVPAPLVLMLIAYLINIVVRAVLERVGFYRLVWHRSIFDLGIYVFVFAAVVIVSPISWLPNVKKPGSRQGKSCSP